MLGVDHAVILPVCIESQSVVNRCRSPDIGGCHIEESNVRRELIVYSLDYLPEPTHSPRLYSKVVNNNYIFDNPALR